MDLSFTIHHAAAPDELHLDWDHPAWQAAAPLELTHFRPEGSAHRPNTSVRLLHDGAGIHGLFRIQDQYVRCRRTGYGSEVWKDSCVEFFLEPKPGRGYFNFEFNCGGAFLCNHIVDPTRTPNWFQQATRIPESEMQQVAVATTLPPTVDPEVPDPLAWRLKFYFPFRVLERYVGPLGPVGGQVWRGNLYKCADESSHPHWASWAPVDELNFHLPRCFGTIRLA